MVQLWYIHTIGYHAITKKNEIGQYVLVNRRSENRYLVGGEKPMTHNKVTV